MISHLYGKAGRIRRLQTLGLLLIGQCLLMSAMAREQIPPSSGQAGTDDRRSGLQYMSPAARALQLDDGQNPAMLAVAQGRALWHTRAPQAGQSCASCHGELDQAMSGVAARYPAWDERLGRALSLRDRLMNCRAEHQQAPAWPRESSQVLALEAAVSLASRGALIRAPDQVPLSDLQRAGERLWRQPFGQLALSCAQCHDDLAGRRLGGSPIPQAHPTAYPVYRLQWESVGSIERRIRGCLTGIRAEPFPAGDGAYLALEAYLMRRAAGMPLEGPGVRP
jgi:sulfur-oxidizing protein SoxA